MSDLNPSDPKIREKKAWQDTGNLALGVWLTFSPGFLDFASVGPASLTSAGLGIVLVAMIAYLFHSVQAWKEAVVVGIGAFLVVSPWLLGFAASPNPTWNSVAVGAAAILLAGLRLIELHRGGRGGHSHGVAPAA